MTTVPEKLFFFSVIGPLSLYRPEGMEKTDNAKNIVQKAQIINIYYHTPQENRRVIIVKKGQPQRKKCRKKGLKVCAVLCLKSLSLYQTQHLRLLTAPSSPDSNITEKQQVSRAQMNTKNR
jgi:hypothetical protein